MPRPQPRPWSSSYDTGYLAAAFSFFLAFFSFTVSLGLLVVLDFSWPLGILQNSLRKPNLARSF